MTCLLYVGNHAGSFLNHRLPVMLALKEQGYTVCVAVPDHADALEQMITCDAVDAIKKLGFVFYPIPINRGRLNPINELRSIINLYALYRQVQPDLVYHSTVKPVLYGGLAARLAHVPAVVNAMAGLGYIFTDESFKAHLIRRGFSMMYRIVMKHPNAIALFQNPDDKRIFVDECLVKEDHAVVIRGSGVDMDLFHPSAFHEQTPIVMLASRLLWNKGVAEFVEASRRLLAQGVHARFVLVGDTDPENPASIPREQLQAWHDSQQVEWWGWKRDMASILQEADIFCLPSFYREGIPKALIEAAATGLPVVTTNTPGCREIVRHGENGFLIPPHDIDALVDSMKDLIVDSDLRKQMGKRSREIAVKAFSVETVANLTIELCEQLLGNRSLQKAPAQPRVQA